MILLDTHVLVWLAAGDSRLGKRATQHIDRAMRTDVVGVSAISFLELAMLVDRGRLKLRASIEALRAKAVAGSIVDVPVDATIAITAGKLRAFQGDPADRVILATAIERAATLVTADARLLDFAGAGVSLVDASA